MNLLKCLKNKLFHSSPRRNLSYEYYDDLGRDCESICDRMYDAFEKHGIKIDGNPKQQIVFEHICMLIYSERNKYVDVLDDEDHRTDPYTAFRLAEHKILYDWQNIAERCYISKDYLTNFCNLVEARLAI